jgi:hypothetical protein
MIHIIYKILVEKPEGKRPLGRPMNKRDNNIRMEFKDIVLQCGLNVSGSG